MQHSWNFLVMIFVVVLSFIGTTQQGCRTLRFLPCLKDKEHINVKKVIKSEKLDVPGEELQCRLLCYLDERCRGITMDKVAGFKRQCYLVNVDIEESPDSFIDRKDRTYCPIRNVCAGKPCEEGHVCKVNYNNDSYTCVEPVTA